MTIIGHVHKRSSPFIDTDVIIRLLTGDDLKKQQAASSLFERVEAGELTLAAPDTVIADAVYVLSSPRLYALARQEIAEQLGALVSLQNFQVQNKHQVLSALSIFASSNLDFGDALLVAAMQHEAVQMLYSYDADFDKIAGITRQEP